MAPRQKKTKAQRMVEIFGDLGNSEEPTPSMHLVPPTPGRSLDPEIPTDTSVSAMLEEPAFLMDEVEYTCPPPTPGHDINCSMAEDIVMYSPSMAGQAESEYELPAQTAEEPYQPTELNVPCDPRKGTIIPCLDFGVIKPYPGPVVVVLSKDPFPYVHSDKPNNSLSRKLHNKQRRDLQKLRKKQAALLQQLAEFPSV
jgi:hypothetical protein